MDVREKLVELIDDALQRKEGTARVVGKRYVNTIADHLIANGVTVHGDKDTNVPSKWISVKDRLPKNICPVLVALEGISTAFNGWYRDGKWWTAGADTRPFIQKVTHWMPLPQPPKGE